jgi:hypothetical protein
MRLSTDIWIGALIRRAELEGAYATVIRKGDPKAGAVLVKALDRRAGVAHLYEAALDNYIDRAVRFDPDIWVVEIDDRAGRHFLTEPVGPR